MQRPYTESESLFEMLLTWMLLVRDTLHLHHAPKFR